VKELFGLPQYLSLRDAHASPFDDANFLDAPRPADNMPVNLSALVPPKPSSRVVERKLSDLQQSLLALDTAVRARSSRLGALIDRLRSGRAQA